MTGGVLGGGVIFVVAALLWAAVLVPAWVRRREFKAAERNAVRLQRTLRVLAETAEVPTEVRVEATAREALAQEKILRTAQKQQEAERQAKLAQARAAQVRAQIKAQQMKRRQAALVRAAKLRRPWVRRLRGFAALVAAAAIVSVLVGAGLALAGQGFLLLGGAALGLVAALGALVLMAPGRVKLVDIPAEHAADESPAPLEERMPEPLAAEPDAVAAAAAHAASQAAAAARIDRARALARARAERPATAVAATERRTRPDSMLLEDSGSAVAPAAPAASPARAAETRDPEADRRARAQSAIDRSVQAAGRPAGRSQQESVSERLRRMGVVGDTSDGMPDLDAALRRHRNAS